MIIVSKRTPKLWDKGIVIDWKFCGQYTHCKCRVKFILGGERSDLNLANHCQNMASETLQRD